MRSREESGDRIRINIVDSNVIYIIHLRDNFVYKLTSPASDVLAELDAAGTHR